MKKRKIYLYIQGACGNQFFQYAFARWLQEKTGAELVINTSQLDILPNPWVKSGILEQFNTVSFQSTKKTTFKERIWWALIGRYRRLRNYQVFDKETFAFICRAARWLPKFGVYYFDAAYHKFIISNSKRIIIQGYYESPRYFEDIDDKIKEELTPKKELLTQNLELYEKIVSTNSVCITIKRQDIENPDISDVYKYDMSYFYAGIEYIKRNIDHPVFFVFADDLEWCRKNVKIDGEYYFETDNNPIWEKIRLMSSCKHFIIHNSTFSWWAQHLSKNQDKIVLAPVKWMLRDDQPIDLYEDNWLYITPDGEITSDHE